jgi:hypothetical protein
MSAERRHSMYADLRTTLSNLSRMSSDDATAFFASLASAPRNDLVKVQWTVTYDGMGRDMISMADISLVHASDVLLQVWLRNAAGGIWIPEIQPWEMSGVEFTPEQSVTATKVGLVDSKWTQDDIGRRYHYELWGFLRHEGAVETFVFEKWATYPSDAA